MSTNGTQSFDLRLRVFSNEHFCCPVCSSPISIAALFNPPPKMAATHRPSPGPIPSQHARLEVFAEIFCAEERVAAADLKAKSHGSEFVQMRRRFCRAASKAGFSSAQIGRWLGMHHTSVLYLMKPKRNGNGSR